MRRFGKIFAILAVVLFGAGLFALPALAQVDLGMEFGDSLGLTTTDIRQTAGTIINAFFGLLGIVVVVIILYAGFLWMTAGGDVQQVDKAKKWLRNAVIGLIIIMASYAIASFVLNAILEGTGAGTPGDGGGGGGGGGLGPGGGAGFVVDGIFPGGPGTDNSGFPKNYNITIAFNRAPNPAAINAFIEVERCNPRLSGDAPQAFDESECAVTPVTRVIDGNRIIIEADGSPEDDPADFEGDYWYRVNVADTYTSDTGANITCLLPGYDIAGETVPYGACERAIAFNDLRDMEGPITSISAPVSSPRYCPSISQIPIIATVRDDFLPAYADFMLEGEGIDALIDEFGAPKSSEINGLGNNPFTTSKTFIDALSLSAGPHTLRAIGYDGAGQPSAPALRDFTMNVEHCCNGIQDADETGEDCGGEDCAGCSGSACTSNEDCAGYCNLETGLCENRPVIMTISEEDMAAGPGTNITIGGMFFGSTPGTVTFLGTESGDEVTVEACSPRAWTNTAVVVTIPDDAVTGPLMITTAADTSDRTDDDEFGPNLGAFIINSEVKPSICYTEPTRGSEGDIVTIYGSAFEDAVGNSVVRMSGTDMDVSTWTTTEVEALVPSTLLQGVYPIRVLVEQAPGVFEESNEAMFTLARDDESAGPIIDSIAPTSGPVGTYVTIMGSGFGNRRGNINIYSTTSDDVASGANPVCDNNWTNNYIVIKIPEEYSGEIENPLRLEAHQIEVETAAPAQTSNQFRFTVNDEPLTPGMCAISPLSGPPLTDVTVTGDWPGLENEDDIGIDAPENSLHFYRSGTAGVDLDTIPATLYRSWDQDEVTAVVPTADDGTWPASGPVYLVSNNVWAGNPIPFTVQDCNDSGGCNIENTVCCDDGSCRSVFDEHGDVLPDACREKRDSAFGWNFSTSVLPDFPVVMRRSSCDPEAGITQSPTPAAGSTDACLDALMSVEFSQPMDVASIEAPGSIIFEECGNGSDINCTDEVPFAGTIETDVVADGGTLLFFGPDATYPPDGENALSGQLRPGYWYRVTLVSNPDTGVGIVAAHEPGDEGERYLDGNYDYRQGGNYLWSFRAKDGIEACDISSIAVTPSRYMLSEEGQTHDFNARPHSANCNILECHNDGPYDIDWDTDPGLSISLNPPPAADPTYCDQTVEADFETGENPEYLIAELIPEGRVITREGLSEVRVAFEDPRVVRVWPTEGCAEACVNAEIGLEFNIGMNQDSLSDGISIHRCRNASCNPPYELTLGLGVTRTATDYIEDDEGERTIMGVNLVGAGNLVESTYYKVRARGGDTGVHSSSGVYLTGLNAPGYYEWIFRTKDDPESCDVTRTELSPRRATLYYVGERLGIDLTAYGPSDECSPEGQRLNAQGYDWNWRIDPEDPVVLSGFVHAEPPPPPYGRKVVAMEEYVDTDPVAARGCGGDCTALGTELGAPQCGNGVVETGEDCDTGALGVDDGCSDACLFEGVLSGECGNGVVNDDLENCDAVSDPEAGGALVFPPGCKNPAVEVDDRPDLSGFGCVLLGATAGRSVCGDGVIADGEACDDGNARDGDGCSSDCLNEGTFPRCGIRPEDDEICTTQCGNGVIEFGEECDGGAGCTVNCLLAGTDPCPPGALLGDGCCGQNPELEPGEACEDGNNEDGDGCSSRCLLEGSSPFYDPPSFCGDGIVGLGEYERCEEGVTPDDNADPYQVVESADLEGGGTETTEVSVGRYIDSDGDTIDLPEDDVGTADVALVCNCDTRLNPDEYCDGLSPADLACADSGCCVPRPTAEFISPVRPVGVCRNAVIEVEFDQEMDTGSLRRNFVVGQLGVAGVDCLDAEAIDELDGAIVMGLTEPEEPHGLLARVWHSITTFVHRHIVRPIIGADGDPAFCPVNGTINIGVNESGITTLTFSPSTAYGAGARIAAAVLPEARSISGAIIGGDGVPHSFEAGDDICLLEKVEIHKGSDLFTSATTPCVDGSCPDSSACMAGEQCRDVRTYTATAYAGGEEEISSTDAYSWTWNWTEQPDDGATGPSVIDMSPNLEADGVTQANTAQIWVRTQDVSPRDGEAIQQVLATISDDSPFGDAGVIRAGEAEIVVMLCDNPWPDWRWCPAPGDTLILPWDDDPAHAKHCSSAGERLWYPFYDFDTGVKFYYCRDGASAGDSTPALPSIKTDEIIRLTPSEDVFAEYLFTFDTGAGVGAVDWEDDAIGFRLTGNLEHRGIMDWYLGRGFRGSPTPLGLGPYDALQEGRTVYVSAPSLNPSGRIFSNVYVFSFNDGAASETVSVFNQILNRTDYNYNLKNAGVCKYEVGVEGANLTCNSDLDCDGGRCDIPESKLARDLKRWADVHEMRDMLLASSSDPTLQEGTFLRGRSYSVWPSWNDTLSAQLGFSAPLDPLNQVAPCPGYDSATCWNQTDREFLCNEKSHIYKYHHIASNPEIYATLEYGQHDDEIGQWFGSTCMDIDNSGECTGTAGCKWSSNLCAYEDVSIYMVKDFDTAASYCKGAPEVGGGECGDGKLNPSSEECELGDTVWDEPCEIGGESGVMERRCLPDCSGYEISTGICVLDNYCGDGRVGAGEDCDDGDLNGTYGHCNSLCSGPGFRCGDGEMHPSEACDCGVMNGRYVEDDDDCSCSWDCQGPAPYCGDGAVNGPEHCDGGYQESSGVCLGSGSDTHPNGVTCSTDEDCGDNGPCVECPRSEQWFRRSCQSSSCDWGQWSCTAPGTCGNGVRDEGEDCDDGNLEDDDACTSGCKINVCGDGYVNWVGGELCDNGASNNVPCRARHGSSCPYCTSACLLGYVSGGFCGDGIIQDASYDPPGNESCEPGTASGGIDYGQICMSIRPEDLSFGAQTGYATCSSSKCVRACEDGESEVCDTSPMFRDFPGPYESCAGLSGDLLTFCQERQKWINDPDRNADFPDECDPDIDNDGVPNVADCEPNDPSAHPRYTIPGTSIVIPAAVETCALIDENCNGTNRDLPEGIYFAADIVFAFDLTGSMDSLVRGVLEGIEGIAADFSGYVDHKFGMVYFAQTGRVNLDYIQDEILPLGDIETFIERLENMDDYWDAVRPDGRPRWKRGSDEPMFASAGYLMTHNSDYDDGPNAIGWREDAHPFIVIVTDEAPGIGGGTPVTFPNSGGDLESFATIDQVAERSLSCQLRGCAPDSSDFVEMFVISDENYAEAWCPALQGCSVSDGGGVDFSGVTRYINIADFSAGGAATQLRNTIFNSVCTE